MSGGGYVRDGAALAMYRLRRAHDLAGRPAEDTGALLRKARAVFLLRARRFASESHPPATPPIRRHYRRKAIIELRAAILMHRLIMARGSGAASTLSR